jgi:hypothetical protein
MSQIDLGKETFNIPSVINDPFKFDKIKSISTHSYQSSFRPYDWIHTGKVEFQNGNTEGAQRFEAKTLDELIILIRNFAIELNNNK